MSDEATPETPETQDAVEAPEAEVTTDATDAPSADASTDSAATAEATGPYALPEDHESLGDDDLEALFTSLEDDIAAAKERAKADPSKVGFADVAEAKAKREAQRTIAAVLTQRQADRDEIEAGIKALDDDAPSLPKAKKAEKTEKAETKTAKAASVPATPAAPTEEVRESVIAAAADRDHPTTPSEPTMSPRQSIVAAAAEVGSHWVNQYEFGESYALGKIVNSTRPAMPGGHDGIEPRPKESVLASVRISDRDPDMELTDSVSHNERAIAEAIERHRDERRSEGGGAKMAAICDPATILRDAMTCGNDATPFQSSLVQMTAQSGNALKFQYRQPTSLADASAGVGEWNVSNQASVSRTDPNTWKPCVSIACPSYDTQSASEITGCYEIDAFTELSSPEAEADFAFAKDRAFARFSEGWYLRKVDTFLRNVSFNGYTGSVPDTIEAVLSAIVSGDYSERLARGDYSVYGSPGVLEALVIDENRKAYRSGPTAAMDDVRQIVEDATGTSYVQLQDLELDSGSALKASPFGSLGAVGAGSATVLPRLNTVTFTLRVLDPSAFVNFSTGEAIFGEQITLDQARRNQRGFFQRVFGGLMKPGCTPGYKISVTLCSDGSRGGFVEPGCAPTGFTDAGVAFVATPAG